ncbi:MAG: LysM peptidoglycan-binding domain-containing protein [Flavobacteriales bacterium]|nr:LysM peptidoglycan-binding domain-containing protein [Flavobacteriales bacterium]
MIRNITVYLFFLTCFTFTTHAQETPQVHKINGSKYYLHVVEPGNTLYGISRLYNVTIDEVMGSNPIVGDEGLKVNQTLLIPVTGDNKKSLGGLVEETDEYITHAVQPKETLYAISKKYAISLDALLNANPQIREEGLKADSQVRIPVAKVEQEQQEFIQSAKLDSLEAHIVEKGQTLYSISKQYHVSIEDLKGANAGLTTNLNEGMAIRIPGRLVVLPEQESQDTQKLADMVLTHVPDAASIVRIGLLLPVQPTFPDSSNRHDFQISEAQRVSLGFYRGFVHAVDSLASKNNVKFEVKLINSGEDTAMIQSLIEQGAFDNIDIAVGPFYTDQFVTVAGYLKQKGVPAICPIPKPSKILFGKPNAIKTTPSESMQLDAIAEFLAANYRDSTVVVVNSNKLPDQDAVEFFKSRYAVAMHVPDTFISDAVREVKLWDITRETLTMRFRDSGSYTLVVPTTNKVFVTKFLSELYNFQYETEGMYRFRVIGLEDWQKYDTDLEIQQLHDLRVTIPITGYLDFTDYRVNAYYKQYKQRYGYEPTRFTLMGFDLAHYLITQMAFNREDWFKTPEEFQFQGILMDFHFHRVMPQSGIENQSVELYEYNGFKLKPFAKWPVQKSK